jgi:hypothetical protein
MPTLPLPIPSLCVKPSSLSPLSCGLSVVGCELPLPLTPLFATLTRNSQLTEKTATLSPFPATLTSRVKPKSFVCHSYEKHGGVGCPLPFFARCSPFHSSVTYSNARNSNPLMRLLHNSLHTRGVGVCPPPSTRKLRLPPSAQGPAALGTHPKTSPPRLSLPPLTFNFQLSTLSSRPESQFTSRGPRATDHGSRATEHRSRTTPP